MSNTINQNKKFFANQKKFKPQPINPIPFTKQEYVKLKQEQLQLLEEKKAVMERLQTAREMGDLSENGAYKYAKFELGNVRRRLNKLDFLISNGFVSQASGNNEVGFGSFVTLNSQTEEKTYQLVSEHESNPRENKLSYKSPLGQLLMNKKVGQQILLTTPKGEKQYQIVKIK